MKILFALLFIVFLLGACSRREQSPPQNAKQAEEIATPFISVPHDVVSITTKESAQKVLLTASVVVSSDISEQDLRSLLTELPKNLAYSHLGEYKANTKQSAVYAYVTKEVAELDQAKWVGMAIWIVGEPTVRVNINQDRLQSARETALIGRSTSQEPTSYLGVYDADGNYRTQAILPFERKVHAALKRQFDLYPEPSSDRYATDEQWVAAVDAVEAKCIKAVAREFKIDGKTVKDIWFKVETLGH